MNERKRDFQVSATSTALRAAPDHAAEQTSRLLLGERFAVLEWAEEGRWARGCGPDGYEGWLRAWHLIETPSGPSAPSLRVTARWSRALGGPSPDASLLADLSFGTSIEPIGKAVDGFLPWILPGGESAWTPQTDLAVLEPGLDPVEALERRGRRLEGIPYEWGGRSSAGLDCSGLVQLLMAGLGIGLPRDAWRQAEKGVARPLGDMEAWRPGDLLFYGAGRIEHVGILLEGRELLHASGFVRRETLASGGALPGLERPPLAGVRNVLPDSREDGMP